MLVLISTCYKIYKTLGAENATVCPFAGVGCNVVCFVKIYFCYTIQQQEIDYIRQVLHKEAIRKNLKFRLICVRGEAL